MTETTASQAPQATPKELFEVHIPNMLKLKPEIVDGIKASFQFSLSGDQGGEWYIDLTKPEFDIKPGKLAEPSVTVTMSATDFLDLSFGNLNPQLAFMNGKLKVRGDLGLALKLQHIIVNAKNA